MADITTPTEADEQTEDETTAVPRRSYKRGIVHEGPGADAARRLRVLRKKAGYKTAAQAAEAMGVKVATYHHHENGLRQMSKGAASEYGRFYGVPAGAIMYGDDATARSIGLQIAPRVLIIGRTGTAGGWVQPSLAHCFDAERPVKSPGETSLNDIGRSLDVATRIDWFSRNGWRSPDVFDEFPHTEAPPGITSQRDAMGLGSITIPNDNLVPMFFKGDQLMYRPSPPPRRPRPIDPTLAGRRCLVLTAEGEGSVGYVNHLTGRTVTLQSGASTEVVENAIAVWPILHIIPAPPTPPAPD